MCRLVARKKAVSSAVALGRWGFCFCRGSVDAAAAKPFELSEARALAMWETKSYSAAIVDTKGKWADALS